MLPFFPGCVLFAKSIELTCYLHMNSKFDIIFILITSCVTILLAFLYLKLRKDRKEKGYIGGLFATIFLGFAAVLAILSFTSRNINYAFI